jgi:hypothetical protein
MKGKPRFVSPRWKRLATAVLGAGMAVPLLAAVPASASTNTSFKTWALCLKAHTSQCLNVKGGVTQAGQPVVLYDINSGGKASQFEVNNDGPVVASGPNPWPFAPGSGLNTEFVNDPVITIMYSPGGVESGWCVADSETEQVLVLSKGCPLSPDPTGLFVQVSPTNWVNVYEEDQSSQGYLWAGDSVNGTEVNTSGGTGLGYWKWGVFIVTWSS